MGGTSWSAAAYTERVNTTRAAGKPLFAYHANVSSGAVAKAAHETLDPKKMKNGVREARDSEAHPNSRPVYVGLDVTGSMARVPMDIQEKLPTLMGLLTRRGYLADPAICVSAIGDVHSDKVPFQVGQFESGVEIDDDIRNLFLEGNGGGNMHESYDIALYFLANCVKSDAWEKRQQKGYAFIICDEELPSLTQAAHLRDVFGSIITEERDLSVDALMAEVQKRWDLFCIIPNMTSHYEDPKYSVRWRKLLGERVLRLEDPNGICELIASTIGVMEENADVDSLVADLKSEGTTDATAASVTRALSKVGEGRGLTKLGGTGLATL